MGFITLPSMVRAAILLAWLVLANAHFPPYDHWTPSDPPTDDCLDCICRATGCECHNGHCHVDAQGVKRCGPFQISEQYWNDCGNPKHPCGLEEDTIMHITCDNDCKLFVDGQQLAVDPAELADWHVTSHVPLFAGSKVLAVESDDWGVIAAFLASFDDGTITDASWKCSSVYEANWASAQYIESINFKAATVIRSNGMDPWGSRPGIASDAQWIWTENYEGEGTDNKVYCRKVLGHVCPVVTNPTCGLDADTTMHITCDNDCKLFVDGQQLAVNPAELADWPTTSDVPLFAGSQVFAVESEDWGVIAAFLASFDDGTVTDASWKCSSVYEDNWASAQFTESSNFQAATVIGPNGMGPWNLRPGIASDAQWIWTENYEGAGTDTKVYCRKVLGNVCPVVVVSDFEDCAKTMECSLECVKTYMAKYRGQCRGGCIGYAMIHDVGPDHCKECPCVMAGGFMDMIMNCLANPLAARPECTSLP